MKKLFSLVLSALMLVSAGSFAQKADSLKKKAKAKVTKATAKVDKKTKSVVADATTATTAASASVTKKATKTKEAATKTINEGVNKSADKAIGKDAKGRTIYLGPKGGQYTLSADGKKAYLKTANKIKVN